MKCVGMITAMLQALSSQGLACQLRQDVAGRPILAFSAFLDGKQHIVVEVHRGAHALDANTSTFWTDDAQDIAAVSFSRSSRRRSLA